MIPLASPASCAPPGAWVALRVVQALRPAASATLTRALVNSLEFLPGQSVNAAN